MERINIGLDMKKTTGQGKVELICKENESVLV